MTKQEAGGIKAVFTRLGGRKPEASKIPTVEESIAAWETNKEKNPEGYKIVRGTDGKPVEIVLKGHDGYNPIFAVLINGTKEPFQIGGQLKSMERALSDLTLLQFISNKVFDGWYEIKGIQRFDVQIGSDTQGFVFGHLAPKPDKLKVREN